MSYAQNQDVRIHYQVEGAGVPLVLHHGFGDSLESWYELGYVQALRDDYRLILVNARGHGASDKPHDPDAYRLHQMAGDIVAVLNTLDITKAHFWGYSMGGWIGFGLATYAPERFHAFVIGGQHPYARSMEFLRASIRTGITQGRAAFVVALEQTSGSSWPEVRRRLLTADLEACLALAQDRPNLAEVLPTIPVPCCLYAGEQDSVYPAAKACSQLIPNVTFFSLPGLNHSEAFVRSDLILPHFTKFLATVAPRGAEGNGKTWGRGA